MQCPQPSNIEDARPSSIRSRPVGSCGGCAPRIGADGPSLFWVELTKAPSQSAALPAGAIPSCQVAVDLPKLLIAASTELPGLCMSLLEGRAGSGLLMCPSGAAITSQTFHVCATSSYILLKNSRPCLCDDSISLIPSSRRELYETEFNRCLVEGSASTPEYSVQHGVLRTARGLPSMRRTDTAHQCAHQRVAASRRVG